MSLLLAKVAVVVFGYLVAVFAIGKFIGSVCSRIVNEEDDEEFRTVVNAGIKRAGKYIGWFERFLVTTFVLVGNYNGIGFILAAKGILRFGEIKNKSDRKFAEYVILGTLLSFSLSFFVALVMRKLLGFRLNAP